jgi:membrane protein DedA with SNARE-associated domain
MEQDLVRYGYILVLLGVMLEGDATLVAAAFLAHRGHFSFPAVLGIAIGASTLVNELFYRLARWGGCERFARNAERHARYARIRDWVTRRGTAMLLLSRYIFGLRLAIPAACGVTGMPPFKFFVINVAGAFLWALPVAFLAYAFGHVLEYVISDLRPYEWWIASALLAAVAGYLFWRGRDTRTVSRAVRSPSVLGRDAAVRTVVEGEHFAEVHPHLHLGTPHA